MGMVSKELITLSAGAVIAVGASRYIWKNFLAPEDHSKFRVPTSPASASKAPASQGGQAAEDGVWIYFASQSGTAEGFAKEIEEELTQKKIAATVVDMEDFDADEFEQHKVVVLVVATYGEGDPTDNSVQFFKWLQDKDLPEDTLKGVQFTVMGLGNRQYVNFNVCAQTADERMEQLGAERIYDRGVGDDDQNIEEDFEQWKDNGLWPALIKATGGDPASLDRSSSADLSAEKVVADLQLRAEVVGDRRKLKVDPLVQVGGADILGKWYFQAHEAPVISERELRQVSDFEDGKSSKHLDLDVSSVPHLDWKTADNLEILPRNTDETVEWFANLLGAGHQLDDTLSFVRADGVDRPVKKPFPTPCSVRDALTLYCDLCQTPTKQVLKKLAAMVEPSHRQKLEALINDRPAYQWLTGPEVRLSFRELIELFMPSLQIDLSTFLQICPRQKNRAYTIASSSREDRNTIGVCVSVVSETLKSLPSLLAELAEKGHVAPGAASHSQHVGEAASENRKFTGLCSAMLCGHTFVGSKLLVASRPSTFRLPRKSTAPVIMVGAGTGIAPFRGFVREFHAEAGLRPKTMLFFGCQKGNSDFLYKDELQEAVQPEGNKPKILTELVTAFSREQKDKVYVQHRIRQRAADVKALMAEGGHLYVCGSVAMGAAIRDALGEALGSPDYVNRLFTEGRYVEELW